MRIILLFIVVTALAGMLQAQSSDTSGLSVATDTSLTNDSALSDVDSAVTAAAVRCTLDIRSIPVGATVLFNNAQFGESPVTITDVDTGKHTIVLQKKGFYQKKAVITISELKRIPLEFELTAPGRISLTTVPDGVGVLLNGERKGETPFIDSLVKPGTYSLRLEQASFSPLEDSIVVSSGGVIERVDTLTHTAAYSDSVAYSAEVSRVKKKRLTLGLVCGAFGVFLMTILAIEGRDR